MTSCNTLYADLLQRLLTFGETINTRNSTVKRLFAEKIVFTETPLVSLRKTAWRNALREWEWFMSGSNRIEDLHESVQPWWLPWADKDGRVNFNYSHQLRSYGSGFDSIAFLINAVKEHPHSRRNVITTWNTEEMVHLDCPITNCHGTVIQTFVSGPLLHLVTYQRSADAVCGLPHNWLQYWAFLLWLAYRTGYQVGTLTWIGGDVHLYDVHTDLARKILHCPETYPSCPELLYGPSGEDFKADDFSLSSEYLPVLKDRAEMVI